MSTIRDVAKAAGVSVATVSRVLNEPRLVRDSTRRRVQEAIRDLNYRPSATARSLSLGRTMSISVAMPFVTRASFVERLRGIEATLSHHSCDLVVSNIESMVKRDSYYQNLLEGRQFDGVVITTMRPRDAEATVLAERPMPVVLLDTTHALLSSVDSDDVEGGRMAARHLLARGHRRIAFLGDNEFGFNFDSARERLQGFREVLNEAGYGLSERDEWWIPYSSRAARELVPQILGQPHAVRPTALFATSDMTALGVLDGLQDAGLRAPDDLAVIGYDDLEMADWYELTTIHQPLFQSGVWAIETLLGQMETAAPPSAPVQLSLPLRLVARATT